MACIAWLEPSFEGPRSSRTQQTGLASVANGHNFRQSARAWFHAGRACRLSPSRREERLLRRFRLRLLSYGGQVALRKDGTEMLGVTSPLVGEVGSHRRCDPGEGLRPIDRPRPLTPTLSHEGRGSALPPMQIPDLIFKKPVPDTRSRPLPDTRSRPRNAKRSSCAFISRP
jgi:hypothetical protein